MQTSFPILRLVGGYKRDLRLSIENPPYLPLVIKALPEPGPMGLHALSVAHYGGLNNNLMRDPKMRFELVVLPSGSALDPYYWRNDYLGCEQYSRSADGEKYVVLRRLYAQHHGFAVDWERVLSMQGYIKAFLRGRAKH